MKEIVTDTLPRFRCSAGACRHTCCAGWEIGVDASSEKRFSALTGPVGEKLRRVMTAGPDGTVIRLTEEGRCPFLLQNGLCEMILACGEDVLCDICRDHPRWRRFRGDRVETGLGMCCETAARTVLFSPVPAHWVLKKEDSFAALSEKEAVSLRLRDTLIRTVQRRDMPFERRAALLCAQSGARAERGAADRLILLLRHLERMDPAWDAYLDRAESEHPKPLQRLPQERFLAAMLMRHWPEQPSPASERACVTAALAALAALRRMTGPDSLIDCVRLFSAETEYSSENTAAIREWALHENKKG